MEDATLDAAILSALPLRHFGILHLVYSSSSLQQPQQDYNSLFTSKQTKRLSFSLFSISLPSHNISISCAQCEPAPPTGQEGKNHWVHLCVLLQAFMVCLLFNLLATLNIFKPLLVCQPAFWVQIYSKPHMETATTLNTLLFLFYHSFIQSFTVF